MLLIVVITISQWGCGGRFLEFFLRFILLVLASIEGGIRMRHFFLRDAFKPRNFEHAVCKKWQEFNWVYKRSKLID